MGFGGKDGIGSMKCPSGYATVGLTCVGMAIQQPDVFENMFEICQNNFDKNSIPYRPTDQLQNVVFRGYLSLNDVRIYGIFIIY